MPLVLVSDTSVLIDLHRGDLLDAALGLPHEFAVPDLLFERELRVWDGPALEGRISVLALDGEGVVLADGFRRKEPTLSLPDAFALALAKTGGHVLLAGDATLRALAKAERVECHGVLWVLDQLEEHGLVEAAGLHSALTKITGRPRCRLPKPEVQKRLERYFRGGPRRH